LSHEASRPTSTKEKVYPRERQKERHWNPPLEREKKKGRSSSEAYPRLFHREKRGREGQLACPKEKGGRGREFLRRRHDFAGGMGKKVAPKKGEELSTKSSRMFKNPTVGGVKSRRLQRRKDDVPLILVGGKSKASTPGKTSSYREERRKSTEVKGSDDIEGTFPVSWPKEARGNVGGRKKQRVLRKVYTYFPPHQEEKPLHWKRKRVRGWGEAQYCEGNFYQPWGVTDDGLRSRKRGKR